MRDGEGDQRGDNIQEVGVAVGVQVDPASGPPSPAFQRRVEEALRERLMSKEIYNSVEDLIDTLKQWLQK